MRGVRSSLALCVSSALAVAAGSALAGPGDPPLPAPSSASVYKNDALGVTVTGPTGWRMATAKAMPSQWTALVSFSEPTSGAEATLEVRPRRSGTVQELRDAVQKEWAQDPTATVVATREIEPSLTNPAPGVDFEVTQVVLPKRSGGKPDAKPETKPGTEPGTPPAAAPAAAPTTMYVLATYWLGPGYEFRLYGTSRSALWPRMRPFVERVRDSFRLAGVAKGPEGEGSYQDELRGFFCRFPKGYTVRIPAQKNHVVEFAGVSAEQPVIAIQHFASATTIEQDAQSLVTYYTEEQNGEATAAPLQVAASSGMLVTARATVGGKDQTFFIAIAKRGGEFFRLRASVARSVEAEGKRVFDAFLATVTLGTPKAPAAPAAED